MLLLVIGDIELVEISYYLLVIIRIVGVNVNGTG